MHLPTAITVLTGIIGAATAQYPSTPESGCGNAIDLIIQACLASEEPLMKLCAVQDWECMCNAASSISSCYNNCPSDPNAFGAKQTETSYCNAAKAHPTTTRSGGWTVVPRREPTPTTPSTVQTGLFGLPIAPTKPTEPEKYFPQTATTPEKGDINVIPDTGTRNSSGTKHLVPLAAVVAAFVVLVFM